MMRRTKNTLYYGLDQYTGEPLTYNKATTVIGGNPITDADCDGIIYRKFDNEYFKRNFSGSINASWYGLNESNADNSLVITNAIKGAYKFKTKLSIPGGNYNVSAPIILTSSDFADQNGVSIIGQGSYRTVNLLYSGTGYCLSYIGSGDEGTSPITRFTIENIFVNGNNNSTSAGGFYLERCYIAKLINCGSVNWAGSQAHAVECRNNFNLLIEGGNYSNGFPTPQGGSVIRIGSKTPNEWNSSNIQIRNTAIQRGGGLGLEIFHEANILDNLVLDNITFGGNQGGSFKVNSPNVNNITVLNCHFESAGYNQTSTPVDANHIDIDQANCVVIGNNEFKDAKIHIKLHRVNSFKILPNKIYETGSYTIAASTGISITGTSSAYSIGSIEHQNIFSNQIDTPYLIDGFSRVDFPNDYVTEAQWNAKYSPNPSIYKNAIITRPDVKSGNVDAAFQSKWTSPDGVNWYRLQVNERGVGWAAAMPTSGSYTQGDVVLNRNPTLAGFTGRRYVVAGWSRITTGSNHVLNTDWTEKREYYDLDIIYTVTTDADYTIPDVNTVTQLSTITTNRNLTLPSPTNNNGRTIIIINRNTGTFSWNVVTPFYRGVDGSSITTIPSSSVLVLVSDGTNWRTINNTQLVPQYVTNNSTGSNPTKANLNTSYGTYKSGSIITYPLLAGGGQTYRKLTDDSSSDWVNTVWSTGVSSLTA